MMTATTTKRRTMRLVTVDASAYAGTATSDLPADAQLAAQVRALQAANARLREENDELRALALVDPLTKLYNRRGLEIELERALCASRRKVAPVALLLIDVDGLKRVNDEHGHPEGDRVLRAVGKAVSASIRASDAAARLGGDEFAVAMPMTDLPGAQVVAERIRAAVAALGFASVTASIGVATFLGGTARRNPRTPRTTMTNLVSAADSALYEAKRTGKNRVVVTP
jgi:diguanylate cyclase (GGDEF)-like protein